MNGHIDVIVNAHQLTANLDRQLAVAQFLGGVATLRDGLAGLVDFDQISALEETAGRRIIPAPLLTNPMANGLILAPVRGAEQICEDVNALHRSGIGVRHRLALAPTPWVRPFTPRWFSLAQQAYGAGFDLLDAGEAVRRVLQQGGRVVVETACGCLEHDTPCNHDTLTALSLLGVPPQGGPVVRTLLTVEAGWLQGTLHSPVAPVRRLAATGSNVTMVVVGVDRYYPGVGEGVESGTFVRVPPRGNDTGAVFSLMDDLNRLLRAVGSPGLPGRELAPEAPLLVTEAGSVFSLCGPAASWRTP